MIRVVDLPMRLSEWLLLLMVMGCGNGVWAEDFQSQYRFRDPEAAIGMPAWFPERQQSSNWSPQIFESGPGANNPGLRVQPIPQDNPFMSPITDYAESPPGLPRGVYRQVERRHTITPHIDGYKFRPIGPVEQVRNKERKNEDRSSATTDSMGRPYGSDSNSGYVPMEERRPRPVYRPDKRLDKGSNQGNRRYPYGPGAQKPLFRPQ